MKSNVIGKSIKEINPNINIQTYIDSVKFNNNHIYDESFFEQLDGIVIAVRNIEARKFLLKNW
jgi:tRNA A37 threonylcarbamoyladenosine dehydratase